MKNSIEFFDNIINECNNQINDKVSGINYLEKLKYLLIEKIQNSQTTFDLLDNKNEKEIVKNYGVNELHITLERYQESKSRIKHKILRDYVSIVLKGSKSIEIYDTFHPNQSNKLNLFKGSGISLTQDTVINESILKNTILLNIFNNKKKEVIEKNEKDII